MQVAGYLAVFFGAHFFAGKAAAIVAPAGRTKNILPFFLPADVFPGKILADGLPFVKNEVGESPLLR